MAKRREESHWLVFTDLTAGLLALFILAFVAMTTMKEKKAEALIRKKSHRSSPSSDMREVRGPSLRDSSQYAETS